MVTQQSQQRAPRFRVGGMRIIYDTGEGFWSAPVVNVSESGLFVKTLHELPAGQQVTIIPDIPDEAQDEQLPFEITGEVVRTKLYDENDLHASAPGLAFRLVGMAPEQAAAVRTFLQSRGVPVHFGAA